MDAPTASKPVGRSLGDFTPLSTAEQRLLDCCKAGELAVLGDALPSEPTEDVEVRAAFVRFLLLGGDEASPVHEEGVHLQGAWLVGALRLSGVKAERALFLWNCRIESIEAYQAQLRFTLLDGSALEGDFEGERLHCASGIFFRSGFVAGGKIVLRGAVVEGNVDLSGATLKKGSALLADVARISGTVFLNRGFVSEGEVRLINSSIGGDLNCEGGTIGAAGGYSLNADGLKIGGNVYLREFTSEGEARAFGAEVGGTFDCAGASFTNAGAAALACDRLKVGGTCFLNKGFRAVGSVRLVGGTLGGDLNCEGGTIAAAGGYSLNADGLKIRGNVYLREFTSEGEARALGAEVGGTFDCAGASFTNAGAAALACDRLKAGGTCFLNKGFRAVGAVRLLGATLGGDLDCSGGRFEHAGLIALNADGIVAEGSVFLRAQLSVSGEVCLTGAKINRSLDCSASAFRNPGATALGCSGMALAGSAFLNNDFVAEGVVSFTGATIGGNLQCEGASFLNPGGQVMVCDHTVVERAFFFRWVSAVEGGIDLSSMRVATLVDDEDSWNGAQDQLILDGFAYDRLSGFAPVAAGARIAWLQHQSLEHLTTKFRPQPWEHLIAVLRSMGRADEAKDIAIEKQVQLRRAGLIPKGLVPFHLLYGLLMGYGYRAPRLLAVVALVWVAGTAAYWAAAEAPVLQQSRALIAPSECVEAGALLPDDDSKRCGELEVRYEDFEPAVYSLDVLLPIVDLGHEDEWSVVLRDESGRLPLSSALRAFYWFEIGFGWIAGALLAALLGTAMKRD